MKAAVGDRVRADLTQAFGRQSDAAEKLKCSVKHLSLVMNGKMPVTLEFALRLEDALGVDGYAEELLIDQLRSELTVRRQVRAGA